MNPRAPNVIKMQAVVYPDEIEIIVDKSAGTDLVTISYNNEQWPVFLKANRTIAYSGRQINDRDFEGNNGDFVGTNFLYNQELSKEQRSVIWLQRMNATVLATNDSILLAEFNPIKYLGYLLRSRSTGLAEFSYRQRDFRYDVKHQDYPAINVREELYYGTYNLARKIEMRSVFEKSNDTEDDADSWLTCCYGGWNDMVYFDQKGFGTDAEGIFDCTCYKNTNA